MSTVPLTNPLTSRPRSPSRPLSNNTTTTGETVTPKNMHTLTSRNGRPHAVPVHSINDSGIGVDTYDPRMPPPPVPMVTQPTPTKEKRRSKPLFGLPPAPWSRPTTPKDEQVPLPSPPQTPRNRPSKVSKIENWFKLGSSFSLLSHLKNLIRLLSRLASSLAGTSSATPSSSRPHIAAPQPFRPATSPHVPADPAEASLRPHSTPPRIHPTNRESSDSERDGRCSPLLGLFTSTRGRGKQREQSQDRHPDRSRKPIVGAPMMRARTASRESPATAAVTKPAGGGPLPSFEFERGGSAEVRRSASHNGHRRVVATHGHSNGNGHAHTHTHTHHRARGHAHSNSLDMRARGLGHAHSHSHRHTHARSPNQAHPPRSHTHPQPSQQRGTTSPHAAPHSPPPQTTDGRPTGASASSQSTAGTAAATGGTGSWGRVARTIDWVRGVGVHPPFAFESAASSTASANGERRAAGDIRERERDRDRERSRRHVAQSPPPPPPHAPVPASPGKSTIGSGTGTGHWEQREVELGLGLTWAPSKIRVREWTPGGTIPTVAATAAATHGGADDELSRAARAQREMEQRVLEREGARRTRERLAEYEMGYVRSRSRSRKDKEVTGRFREVLGAEGFEAFKKCERGGSLDWFFLECVLTRRASPQTCAGSTRISSRSRARLAYLGVWDVCWIRHPRARLARLRSARCWTIWCGSFVRASGKLPPLPAHACMHAYRIVVVNSLILFLFSTFSHILIIYF